MKRRHLFALLMLFPIAWAAWRWVPSVVLKRRDAGANGCEFGGMERCEGYTCIPMGAIG